jgi:hypothetical protein
MAPNPTIMQAVEQLGYRVTLGDVATQAGLNVAEANQGLLAFAAETGAHLQVAETGDIIYLFPKNFRVILRKKYWQLRSQEWWKKVWSVLFYLIRISFAIFLIASIALIAIATIIIITAINSDRDSNGGGNSNSHGGGWGFFYFPDLFWYFSPDYRTHYQERRRTKSELNFFEAVFSFLFGDGNPNTKLEERRWREIGSVIRNNRGAVVAEQISPYLDNIGEKYQQEYEDYMLPVLTRFNGQPAVSPQGEIVYYFPELQVSAAKKRPQSESVYLEEFPWRCCSCPVGWTCGFCPRNLLVAFGLRNRFLGNTASALFLDSMAQS